MSSSGNTPSTERTPALWVVLSCEDNPKMCTGRRTIRFGLAIEATPQKRPKGGVLLLDPHSPIPLTLADAPLALEKGVMAVDCSWNKLGARGGYPSTGRWLDTMRTRRRLPLVLAANPQHYGRLGELNTAEALGCSIYVISGEAAARVFLERFSFGRAFLDLNGGLLDSYRGATSVTEVEELEAKRFCFPAQDAG